MTTQAELTDLIKEARDLGEPGEVRMNCPDCNSDLRGDGSCCDHCGWTWHGGGDDPKLPSGRPLANLQCDINARTARRARRALDHATTYIREALSEISTLPDTTDNRRLYENLMAAEYRIKNLQSSVQ